MISMILAILFRDTLLLKSLICTCNLNQSLLSSFRSIHTLITQVVKLGGRVSVNTNYILGSSILLKVCLFVKIVRY